MIAAAKNNIDMVRLLLDEESNVPATDNKVVGEA